MIHESWPPTLIWTEVYGDAVHPDVREVAESALRGCDELVFVAEATRVLFRGQQEGVVVRTGIPSERVRDYCAAVSRTAARRAACSCSNGRNTAARR